MKIYAFNKVSNANTLATPYTIKVKGDKGLLTYRRKPKEAKLEVGDKLVLGILTNEKRSQVAGEVIEVSYRDHKSNFTEGALSPADAIDGHGTVAFIIYDAQSSAQVVQDWHKQNSGK